MSQLFIVLVLFITQALGQQEPQPDANCTAWLASQQGIDFTACENDFPGLPTRTPSNNCSLTQNDYDLLCNDTCYTTMVDGYDFILSTGTCLNLYEYYFGPCSIDSDCTNPALGARICIQGVCYTSCNTSADCNSCNSETCGTIGQVSACQSNFTKLLGNSTFRGNVYQLQATCSQNTQDDYCSLLFSNITEMDLSNVTCSNFESWGCCLGEMLTTMEYCEFLRFNEDAIYKCNSSNLTCAPLQPAQQFCALNLNQTNNGSSSSSGLSSSMTGSSGLNGSSLTGSSSHSISRSSSAVGTGGNNGTDGNSAGTVAISWSLLLGLFLITSTLS